MIHAHGKKFRSPGGSFAYQVSGPVCRLFDRDELPWPSCSLQWKGKQPSWRRIGPRFVPDISARRCPSYAVHAVDSSGVKWEQVLTLYDQRLNPEEQDWWYSKYHASKPWPEKP